MSLNSNIFRFLYKWLYCSWAHYKDRCYPEVWGRGLDGPWHCSKCHPCNEIFAILFEEEKKTE